MINQRSMLCWRRGAQLGEAPAGLGERVVEMLIANEACYSTALILAGEPKWAKRHARRLRRDARALGIGEVDESEVLEALAELSHAAFAAGGSKRDGVVRVVASRTNACAPELVALSIEATEEPSQWRASQAPFAHDTEGRVWTGAKGSNFPLYTRAREWMAEKGLEEVLLVDAEDCVVEGCRSNIFVVAADGELVAPNLSRGAVAGLAQELVHEGIPEVVIRDMKSSELPDAREIIAVNSLCCAKPIVQLDGKPMGSGTPGPWHQRLLDLLSSEP